MHAKVHIAHRSRRQGSRHPPRPASAHRPANTGSTCRIRHKLLSQAPGMMNALQWCFLHLATCPGEELAAVSSKKSAGHATACTSMHLLHHVQTWDNHKDRQQPPVPHGCSPVRCPSASGCATSSWQGASSSAPSTCTHEKGGCALSCITSQISCCGFLRLQSRIICSIPGAKAALIQAGGTDRDASCEAQGVPPCVVARVVAQDDEAQGVVPQQLRHAHCIVQADVLLAPRLPADL